MDDVSRVTRPSWRRMVPLLVAGFMFACAAQDTQVTSPELAESEQLFMAGYRNIADIYIWEVPMSDLAVAGLRGLESIDPALATRKGSGRMILERDGALVGAFPLPPEQDAEGWGTITAAALEAARAVSPEIQDAEPERLYEVIFDNMISELDGFSRYAGREEARDNRASRDGFGGIGVRIRLVDDGVRVLSVMNATPAQRAGLEDNDVIVEIDGTPTIGLSQRDVVRRLRGPLRSAVALTVKRDAPARLLALNVVRAHIVPETVRYARLGNVAHLRVAGFNQSTTRTLRDKIRLAEDEIGPDLAGFIVDLRGNPGGLLDQAVTVSDLFVTGGRIVSTHGRHPDSHQYFDANIDDLTFTKPVVVLVDGNSASASEIVAAALQDSGRALVAGTSSYGKGTVQTVLRMPNEGELTLTWAQFYAPSGYGLDRRGVMPDVCLSSNLGDLGDADAAMEQLRQGALLVDRSLMRTNLDGGDDTALSGFRAVCPSGASENDVELEVTRRLLEEPDLFARTLRGASFDTAAGPETQSAIAHSPQ